VPVVTVVRDSVFFGRVSSWFNARTGEKLSRSSTACTIAPPGMPAAPHHEVDRLEWRGTDPGEPDELLAAFLAQHHLGGPVGRGRGETVVALLLGAVACARLAGLPAGRGTPVPAVPELVAVALEPGAPAAPYDRLPSRVAAWRTTWSDGEHAAAVQVVREAIARGEVYQANVVGHRSAGHRSDPRDLAAAAASLPGAAYGGMIAGEGWAVGCASPEQLVRVSGNRITTVPIKGTMPVGPGSAQRLRGSAKDRAEHIMIVDLERNDLSRLAVTGTVEVEQLFALTGWSGLWQACSTIAARLRPEVSVLDVLRALAPGGSVTGAPKHAACALLAGLEPVGRGPAMGAFGVVHAQGMDLGLTIRTVAADEQEVHLWAGGGITWGSEPAGEVAEAHAKAAPLLRALRAP
jgi:para-aminobenzoate synthetase component 1